MPALLALALIPSAMADHVEPETVPGPDNHTCSDFTPDEGTWEELKVDPPRDGTSTSEDGRLTVTLDVDEDVKTFDWTATEAIVGFVFVKAGSEGHHLYTYDPLEDADTGLTTPGEGTRNQISHVSFCYNTSAPETPPCEEGTPDCQPTCEDQPDMPECQPTCEDQPDMPECAPTCEDNTPECQPTCEDQPDMPECQPTCEENPDNPACQPTCDEQPSNPECAPTCDDQPDMPECVPSCEDNPDSPECQPECQPAEPECQPTCEDQPDMEGCETEAACPTGLAATPSQDGSIRLDFTPAPGSDGSVVYRAFGDGDFAQAAELAEGVDTWVDSASEPGESYRYTVTAMFGDDEAEDCPIAEATAIPDFPTVLAAGGAVGASLLAYAFARRK